MALASLADVKRVLRLTDENASRDAQLRGALDAVESWADSRLWRVSREGNQVETYYDVYEDATLHLPAPDVVVTLVKIFYGPESEGSIVESIELGFGQGYEVTEDGKLILRPLLTTTPFEGVTAARFLSCYDRVEVHYRGTGVVPRAVTEGIALLAAGYWKDGPRALAGIKSEKIGDYSYTLSDEGSANSGENSDPPYVGRALFFLRPYLKRARVSVT